MSDEEQVSQALAELWDVVKCRCHAAYTGRGLHDPDCQCDSTEAVQTVADRIEALTEQLAAARQDAEEAEAYAWQLEQQLGKAVETLKVALRYNNAMHGGAGAYNKRIKDFIAELKGHDDE